MMEEIQEKQKQIKEIKQKFLALQIRNGKKVDLPEIKYWSKEICDALNEKGYFGEIQFDNKCDYKDDQELKNKIKDTYFSKYSLKIEKVIKTSFDPICECPFVCINHSIIINNNNNENDESKLIKDIAQTISKGSVTAVQNDLAIKKIMEKKSTGFEILSYKEDDCKEDDCSKYVQDCAKLMQNISMVSAINEKNGILRSDKQKDNISYGDNVIAYELLQNVNDCKKRSKKRNEDFTGKDSSGNDLNITINNQEEKSIKLEYAEDGFTAADLLAICTLENTGNYNSEESTGHKGTGFKCIYNVFDKVKIDSRYFTVEFRLNEHPKYEYNVETGDINILKDGGLEQWEEEHKPKFPVPYFSFNKDNKNITTLTAYMKEGCVDGFNNISDDLKDSSSYLFLTEIRKIGFTEDNKSWTMQITDVADSSVIDSNNKIADKKILTICNSQSKEEVYTHFVCTEKDMPRFEVLFPENKSKLKYNYYCDLPMTELKPGYNFIVNMSNSIEPYDNRKTYTCDQKNSDIKNKEIKNKEMIWFVKIFEQFAKNDYKKALDYLPVKNNNSSDERFSYWNDDANIYRVDFIPAKSIDDSSETKCSIESLVNRETIIFEQDVIDWLGLELNDCKNKSLTHIKLKEYLNEGIKYYLDCDDNDYCNKLLNIFSLKKTDVDENYWESFEDSEIIALMNEHEIAEFLSEKGQIGGESNGSKLQKDSNRMEGN